MKRNGEMYDGILYEAAAEQKGIYDFYGRYLNYIGEYNCAIDYML